MRVNLKENLSTIGIVWIYWDIGDNKWQICHDRICCRNYKRKAYRKVYARANRPYEPYATGLLSVDTCIRYSHR